MRYIILLFIFILSIGLTYGFFSIPVEGNGKNITVETGTLRLKYIDGNEIIINDIYPNDTFAKTVSVTNTGSLSTSYDIVWKELNNNILYGELKYNIICTSYINYRQTNEEEYGSCQSSLSNSLINNKNIISGVYIMPNVTHVYTIEFILSETGSVQNYNQGKNFYGLINVEESTSSLITIKNILDGRTDFSNAENYLGDIVKINSEFLNDASIVNDNEYLYNTKTKEIYSLSGENYNGTTYHTDVEYKLLTNNDIDATTKSNLLELKYYYINRLKSSQYSTGAFPTYGTNDTHVIPYFALSIVLSMEDDLNSLKNVKDYLVWHFNHINMNPDVNGVSGTIYDYIIDRDTLEETTEEDYDSVDSYAALLYIVLYKYYQKTNDTTLFNDYKDEIEATINSLDMVYDTEKNMTLAKTTFNIFYALDNSEVVESYKALANIYNEVYNDQTNYAYYLQRYNTMKLSVYNNLYNPSEDMFDWAYGVPSASNISSTFYPNVTAQFYQIYYNIVDANSDLAKHLYYLTTYYSTSSHFDWFNYEYILADSTELRFSNNLQIYSALMMDSTIETDNVTINVKEEVEKAFETLYEDSKLTPGTYRWYLGEDANTLLSLNKYFDRINNGW